MTITVPSNYTPHMNVAQVLVEQLAQVGITATIKPVEWETWLSETYMGRDFESTVVGFDAATLSAGALLNRWMSDNENNMINYDNPEYDAIMEKANTTTDDAEQTSCTSRRPNCSRRPRPMSISRTWRTLCSLSLTWTGISSIPCT